MMNSPQHISGETFHRRRGDIRHKFRYGVDYVLIDPEATQKLPFLFSRNKFNLSSVHDRDHGGTLGAGRGPKWVREVLAQNGLNTSEIELRLLTQPRFLGYSFNPVSFWFAVQGEDLIAAIAEVSTPFGDRHSYLCHTPDFAPITAATRMTAPKSLHVSPFQSVEGLYEFAFDIDHDNISIRIWHRNGASGVLATLEGPRLPLSNSGLIRASLRRPFGALRTSVLIYWQALRLKLKGAIYRTRPTPPKTEVTNVIPHETH
jgi:DUF1365 family protein